MSNEKGGATVPPPTKIMYEVRAAGDGDLGALGLAAQRKASPPPPAPENVAANDAPATFASVARKAAPATGAPSAPQDRDIKEAVLHHVLGLKLSEVRLAHWTTTAGPMYVMCTLPFSELTKRAATKTAYEHVVITTVDRQKQAADENAYAELRNLAYTVRIEHYPMVGYASEGEHDAVGRKVAEDLCAKVQAKTGVSLKLTDVRYDTLRQKPLTLLYLHSDRMAEAEAIKAIGCLDDTLRTRRTDKNNKGYTLQYKSEDPMAPYAANLRAMSWGPVHYTRAEKRCLVSTVADAPASRFVHNRTKDTYVLKHALPHTTAARSNRPGNRPAENPSNEDDPLQNSGSSHKRRREENDDHAGTDQPEGGDPTARVEEPLEGDVLEQAPAPSETPEATPGSPHTRPGDATNAIPSTPTTNDGPQLPASAVKAAAKAVQLQKKGKGKGKAQRVSPSIQCTNTNADALDQHNEMTATGDHTIADDPDVDMLGTPTHDEDGNSAATHSPMTQSHTSGPSPSGLPAHQ